jgi:hypothetical protein
MRGLYVGRQTPGRVWILHSAFSTPPFVFRWAWTSVVSPVLGMKPTPVRSDGPQEDLPRYERLRTEEQEV